ncbi:MAG: carbohydrate ABC transporter permease [Sumerlaeia bacterium]
MNHNPQPKLLGETVWKYTRLIFPVLILSLGAFLMVFPFIWMISTSLKTTGGAFSYPPTLIPETLKWENYTKLFTTVPMGTFLLNSVKISGLTVLGMIISSSMAAYALALLNFPGRKLLFVGMLATLMIPYQVLIIPTFILYDKMGVIDQQLTLWLPAWFGGAFYIFLLRQFYVMIPRDLYEAAMLECLSPGAILFQIYMPLSKPALATVALLTFMASWNDLLNPLVFLNTMEKFPLTAGLSFLQGQYGSDWPVMMASAVISVVPILIFFLFSQRYFIEGVANTGLK